MSHKITSAKDAGEWAHTCACGAVFRSRYSLATHVQKWNSKHNLRDKSPRSGVPAKAAKS